MAQLDVEYVLDKRSKPKGVIVPIRLWHEIQSERETAYLLKSPTMKKRLLKAKQRNEGISFEVAREKRMKQDPSDFRISDPASLVF